MKFDVDAKFIIDCFKDIVNVPSPVGYYVKMNPVLEEYAAKFGRKVTYDNKSTAYITLEGEDNSKTVLVGAHPDTLGMVVRTIDANGMIRVRQLGGVNYHSYEGETVTIHTRDGREYTGLMTCQSHSVHVFDDARTLPRDENTMMIILDEKVSSKEDVKALGIRHGDFISVEPRCQVTENGYIKSRFIDDKTTLNLNTKPFLQSPIPKRSASAAPMFRRKFPNMLQSTSALSARIMTATNMLFPSAEKMLPHLTILNLPTALSVMPKKPAAIMKLTFITITEPTQTQQ